MTKTLPAILQDEFDLKIWNEEMLDEDGNEREFSDEDRAALMQLAEEHALEFARKAEGYGKALNEIDCETATIEARIDFLENELKRLKARKKTRDNNVSFLKSLMVRAMKLTDTLKIKTPLFNFSVRKSESIDASRADASSLPKAFVRCKYEIDKTAIKDAVKSGSVIVTEDGTFVYNGEVLDGIRKESKETLQIR